MRNETDNADVPPFLTLMAEKYTGIRKTYVSDSFRISGRLPPHRSRIYHPERKKTGPLRHTTRYWDGPGLRACRHRCSSIISDSATCAVQCAPRMGPMRNTPAIRPNPIRCRGKTIDRIAEESFPYAGQCSTSGIGEGLLHKDLDAIIAQASRYGTRLFINSNGTSLGVASFHRLFGITELQLSIDGALPATFEAIRKGADYSKNDAGDPGVKAGQ